MMRGRPSPREIRLDLKHLEKWADAFADVPLYEEAYINFKIPVSSGTAFLAQRYPAIERRILEALLKAAQHLANHPKRETYSYFRVAALTTPTPSYFSSEATIFLDADYYRRFWHENALPHTEAPLYKHKLILPEGWQVSGTRWTYKDDEDGTSWPEEHWTYGEPA